MRACISSKGSHRNFFSNTDVDECTNENICDVNAQCVNTEGSYECVCNPGYSGNGTMCSEY